MALTVAAIPEKVLDWLLAAPDPLLRYHVLTDILQLPPDESRLQTARHESLTQEWVQKTLAAHNGDGTWGGRSHFYQKYRGTSWVLLHLSELGICRQSPAVRRGVDYLLNSARSLADRRGREAERFSGCSTGYYWYYPIPCLMAHMSAVLSRNGLSDHDVTRGALAACARVFDPAEGFDCEVIEHSLQPRCVMSVPKVLKAYLAVPETDRTAEDQEIIRRMIALLKKFHLYKYLARDNREWWHWALKVSGSERRKAKQEWIQAGRSEPRREKEGWTRFSFPNNYNSDILEILLLIGQVDNSVDTVMEEGLGALLNRQTRDGRWKLTGGLNGKMYADLDVKNQPSPWITYRALKALKLFNLLKWK